MYFDDHLQLGQPDLSAQVSQMKQKGVQLIFTCIDQAESLILAKELAKQHLERGAVRSRTRTTRSSSADNAQYLEGSFVAPQFAALEYSRSSPRPRRTS